MINITSEHGRIGPFWWLNAVTTPIKMSNATYNGSVHYVWRPGIFSWKSPMKEQLHWRVIK
jgi:hypothetical protein